MKDLSLAISILKDIKVDTKWSISEIDYMIEESSRIKDSIETVEFATESLEIHMTRLDRVIDFLEQLNKM